MPSVHTHTRVVSLSELFRISLQSVVETKRVSKKMIGLYQQRDLNSL